MLDYQIQQNEYHLFMIVVIYKRIAFTPYCWFSGANAPYVIPQIGSIISQLCTAIDTTQNIRSSVTGNRIYLLFSSKK